MNNTSQTLAKKFLKKAKAEHLFDLTGDHLAESEAAASITIVAMGEVIMGVKGETYLFPHEHIDWEGYDQKERYLAFESNFIEQNLKGVA